MEYTIIANQYVINVIGIEDTAQKFEQFLSSSKIIEKFDLTKIDYPINFPDNFPDSQKQAIIMKCPFRKFINDDVIVNYIEPENVVSLQLNETGNLSVLEDIALNVIVPNFEQIKKLGFNYSKIVNYGETKLKLLNEDITKFPYWKNNQTFTLTIPLKFEDYTSAYTIQKLIPVDKDDTRHIYQLDANFEFDVTSFIAYDKHKRIELLLNDFNNKYKKEFDETCKDFLGLKYE